MKLSIPQQNLLPGTYFITGITGFIGSLLTRCLLNSSAYAEKKIQIYGLVRNLEKAQALYSDYNCSQLHFIKSDLVQLNPDLLRHTYHINEIDYIFHCAANTRSSDMVTFPVETAGGIILGTGNVLELAKQFSVKSIVYLSSMEVYGEIDSGAERTTEETLGAIDPFSSRSCYPLGKRMAENLCFSYYKEYDVPVKIARLAQTFGPGILPDENRVFSQFARCAIEHNDILLHTKGDSTGNYVDSFDAVNALLLLLKDGKNGEAYNIANESLTMTILDMAQLVAQKIAHNKIQVLFDIPKNNQFGYAAKTNLRLSASKIKALGWAPKFNMEDMYERMIADMI